MLVPPRVLFPLVAAVARIHVLNALQQVVIFSRYFLKMHAPLMLRDLAIKFPVHFNRAVDFIINRLDSNSFDETLEHKVVVHLNHHVLPFLW
jgi:hypothetical protein